MPGKVVLVGAGPGDVGLLTLKGRQMLEMADVLVYDRLVCDDILSFSPQSKKIYVGKQQGNHPVPQDEINAILLREAQANSLVVRLKGGDPYLFGRGSEEAEYLAQHGISFEVVPGVTSALAALSYAGIPATARGVASSVHIVTGHAQAGEALDIDFAALARTKGTLVFLMAVASMPAIAQGLLAAGLPDGTPAAVVENGTLPEQRRVDGTLGGIVEAANQQAVQSPAIFVVGDVCVKIQALDWFTTLPLYGKTVVVTRPRERAGTLGEKLRALGAQVVAYPCIEAQAADERMVSEVLQRLNAFDWLVSTSPQGVQSLWAALEQKGMDSRALAPVKIAAIGAGTAAELAGCGIKADYVPNQYSAEELAKGLLERLTPSDRVLLLRAEKGTPALPVALKQQGIRFEDVAIYHTTPCGKPPQGLRQKLEAGQVEYVTFTSATTVEGFAKGLKGLQPSCFMAVCIGEATEAAARQQGYHTITAANATIDCLIQAILEDNT